MSQKSDESLPDRIKGTRRKFLAGLGGLAAAGAASANLGGDDDSGLQAGGLNAPLGSQYYRDQYISSDPSTFDPSVMQAGEQYWLSDGEIGVYDGSQTQQYPVGSPSTPVPEVNATNMGVGSLNVDELWNTHYAAADDDLQTVIDNANPGETVIMEAAQRTEPSVPVIDKPLNLKGESFSMGRADMQNMDGAHILVQDADTNGLKILADRQAVHLSDFGIKFDGGLSSTGHGIVSDAVSDGSTNKEIGLQEAEWSNLGVRGHDGDHYAFQVVNPQHNLFMNLKWAPGGGIEFVNDHASINCGNTTVVEMMGELDASGTAHGIHHHAIESRMNLNQFYRPQVNVNTTINAGQMHVEYTEDAGGNVARNYYSGANFESFDEAQGGTRYSSGSRVIPIIHSAPDNGKPRMYDGTDLGGSVIIDKSDIDARILTASSQIQLDDGTLRARIRYRNNEKRIEDEQGPNPLTHFDKANGIDRWKSKGDGGMMLQSQDLSTLSLGSGDDADLYLHDGSSSVTLTDGSTQSNAGYYRWDNAAAGFSYLG